MLIRIVKDPYFFIGTLLGFCLYFFRELFVEEKLKNINVDDRLILKLFQRNMNMGGGVKWINVAQDRKYSEVLWT